MYELFFDVIIIGGGPAGSTCGIFLKKLNPDLRVCIIDRHSFPRTKTCGDGISPQVVDIIRRAGIPDFFHHKVPVSQFILSIGNSVEIGYDLRKLSANKSEGYVYPRELFDHKLLQHAASLGVQVYENHEFTHIADKDDEHTDVLGKYPKGDFNFSGKVIVGADGAHSKLRRYLKVPPNSNRHAGIALRHYCQISDLGDLAIRIDLLTQLKNSYGWLFPVSGDFANVGIGVDVDVYKKNKLNLDKEFDNYLSFLSEKVKVRLVPGTKTAYSLPFASHMPRLVHSNKVLIGDAASMINPLTGEGIYYGMQAGELLATHLAPSLSRAGKPDLLLAEFARDFKAQFHKHYQLNYKIKKLLNSRFSDVFLNALIKDNRLIEKAMNVILDNSASVNVGSHALSLIKYSTKSIYERFKKNVS